MDSERSSIATSSLKMYCDQRSKTPGADVADEIGKERVPHLEGPHVGHHAPLRGEVGRIAAGAGGERRDVVGQQPLQDTRADRRRSATTGRGRIGR